MVVVVVVVGEPTKHVIDVLSSSCLAIRVISITVSFLFNGAVIDYVFYFFSLSLVEFTVELLDKVFLSRWASFGWH